MSKINEEIVLAVPYNDMLKNALKCRDAMHAISEQRYDDAFDIIEEMFWHNANIIDDQTVIIEYIPRKQLLN